MPRKSQWNMLVMTNLMCNTSLCYKKKCHDFGYQLLFHLNSTCLWQKLLGRHKICTLWYTLSLLILKMNLCSSHQTISKRDGLCHNYSRQSYLFLPLAAFFLENLSLRTHLSALINTVEFGHASSKGLELC